MLRFWALVATFTAATALAMGLTLATPIGFSLWHYHVPLAALALLAIPALPLLRRRRVVTLGMAGTGVLASISGFVMLYTKDFPYKEWLTWWHSVTSFAFLGLFLAHWWHNQPRLLQFTKRIAGALPQGPLAGGAWTAGVIAGVVTWTPDVASLFTRENYLLLASWAIWWGIALTWGLWLWYRRDRMRARLRKPDHRNDARALVDTSLFLACWLALLTGFALLYFPTFLNDNGYKYVSKWWHTATSVLLLALVALHVGFNARPLRAHAARVDQELRPGAPPR